MGRFLYTGKLLLFLYIHLTLFLMLNKKETEAIYNIKDKESQSYIILKEFQKCLYELYIQLLQLVPGEGLQSADFSLYPHLMG